MSNVGLRFSDFSARDLSLGGCCDKIFIYKRMVRISAFQRRLLQGSWQRCPGYFWFLALCVWFPGMHCDSYCTWICKFSFLWVSAGSYQEYCKAHMLCVNMRRKITSLISGNISSCCWLMRSPGWVPSLKALLCLIMPRYMVPIPFPSCCILSTFRCIVDIGHENDL